MQREEGLSKLQMQLIEENKNVEDDYLFNYKIDTNCNIFDSYKKKYKIKQNMVSPKS